MSHCWLIHTSVSPAFWTGSLFYAYASFDLLSIKWSDSDYCNHFLYFFYGIPYTILYWSGVATYCNSTHKLNVRPTRTSLSDSVYQMQSRLHGMLLAHFAKCRVHSFQSHSLLSLPRFIHSARQHVPEIHLVCEFVCLTISIQNYRCKRQRYGRTPSRKGHDILKISGLRLLRVLIC